MRRMSGVPEANAGVESWGCGVIVLCSNDLSRRFVAEARLTGKLGWLMGPLHFKRPVEGIPFALDNDGYINWTKGLPFNATAFWNMLEKIKASGKTPLWLLVPDSVANREETLKRWEQYLPAARDYGWPLAFAVQDGMTRADVPKQADVVFVGGTTSWKWRTLPTWAQFPRVHVGRVNGLERLWRCQELGVESCDGSGFFREGFHGQRANGIKAWLHHKTDPQRQLPPQPGTEVVSFKQV